ncbi:hypothetical protein BOTBODRAFT_34281 [Botryobasidium botryosum FD-172 SS1]|uniref:Uncharacterized protein n=1 Tax=Botryobasidium botryosum (strain FD-172 SS1) TaxID=930990 RepID=A0A067MAE6_BOTB1|nr:hypothetical protein BOTBODRAFT_34281 [Botryobasidium botryosum FD-172 SS1]
MAQAAPSQFSALLRRSKFASFDPQIAQVYTSYGGHSHRGQFGLKRSLPSRARTRNPLILVSAVDTPEHQTEWRHGADEGKWIKRWEGVGVQIHLDEMGKWQSKYRSKVHTWDIDSEYDSPSRSSPHSTRPTSTPTGTPGENATPFPFAEFLEAPSINTMSKKQFERYLEKIRKLRPLFKQYLERQKAPKAVSLYALAQQQSTDPAPFISDLRSRAFIGPDSTKIAPFPHPNGGLSYTRHSQLQTHLLYPSAPGRILAQQPSAPQTYSNYDHRDSNKETPYMIAGVAGALAKVYVSDSMGKVPVKWGTLETESGRKEVEGSTAKFRVSGFKLLFPPTVTKGHTSLSGVKGAKMEVTVRAVFETDPWTVLNPHRLGTSEYIIQENRRRSPAKKITGWVDTSLPGATMSRYARPSASETSGTQGVLNTLADLLPKTQ